MPNPKGLGGFTEDREFPGEGERDWVGESVEPGTGNRGRRLGSVPEKNE
jgi:hypothetical protein